MGTTAACRQIRPVRQSLDRDVYRRNAVNTGFYASFSVNAQNGARIKDSVLIDSGCGMGNFLTCTDNYRME